MPVCITRQSPVSVFCNICFCCLKWRVITYNDAERADFRLLATSVHIGVYLSEAQNLITAFWNIHKHGNFSGKKGSGNTKSKASIFLMNLYYADIHRWCWWFQKSLKQVFSVEVRVLFCQWVVTAAHCVVFNNVLQSPSQFTGKVCY
jgi:hypothetical protein